MVPSLMVLGRTVDGISMTCRCRAYIFPDVKNVPIDVSSYAQLR